jgi:phosphopantetheine adenylyltransferase
VGHYISVKNKLFDTVIIGITQNSKKPSFLTINDRLKGAKDALTDIHTIKVMSFDTR